MRDLRGPDLRALVEAATVAHRVRSYGFPQRPCGRARVRSCGLPQLPAWSHVWATSEDRRCAALAGVGTVAHRVRSYGCLQRPWGSRPGALLQNAQEPSRA